ncbi:MAG: hypothetical protein KAZ26_13965 [Caldilineaceae bacterium]|nr:hypothetical protein [Caldilineaceae bacterium]
MSLIDTQQRSDALYYRTGCIFASVDELKQELRSVFPLESNWVRVLDIRTNKTLIFDTLFERRWSNTVVQLSFPTYRHTESQLPGNNRTRTITYDLLLLPQNRIQVIARCHLSSCYEVFVTAWRTIVKKWPEANTPITLASPPTVIKNHQEFYINANARDLEAVLSVISGMNRAIRPRVEAIDSPGIYTLWKFERLHDFEPEHDFVFVAGEAFPPIDMMGGPDLNEIFSVMAFKVTEVAGPRCRVVADCLNRSFDLFFVTLLKEMSGAYPEMKDQIQLPASTDADLVDCWFGGVHEGEKMPNNLGLEISPEGNAESTELWERIPDKEWYREGLRLWHAGHTYKEIGIRIHRSEYRVRNVLSELRGKHGEEIVPTDKTLKAKGIKSTSRSE